MLLITDILQQKITILTNYKESKKYLRKLNKNADSNNINLKGNNKIETIL